MSFLDSIVSDPADQDGEAPVLILPAKALNSVELSYRGAMAVEMASLKLPGLFVDDARINDEWRAVGCETADR
jgi:hypothetical protein